MGQTRSDTYHHNPDIKGCGGREQLEGVENRGAWCGTAGLQSKAGVVGACMFAAVRRRARGEHVSWQKPVLGEVLVAGV
jgi:hypothetical protein